MNIAFFGSPAFVIPILDNLDKNHGISLVVSQPDKPVGRKKLLTPTAVKDYATKHGIPVQTPSNLTSQSESGKLGEESILDLANIDLAIVAAYGLIIPKSLLDQPKHGFLNLHYSLLPKYRGASPVQSTLLNGDNETGTTIMQMDDKLDHGDIISQEKVEIALDHTTDSLLNKLTQISVPLLNQIIQDLINCIPLSKTAQNHSEATFTEKLAKQDAFVDYEDVKKAITGIEALAIHNKIRAYYPWPVVWTVLPNGKRCKLISSDYIDKSLSLTNIKIEGKTAISDSKFINILFK